MLLLNSSIHSWERNQLRSWKETRMSASTTGNVDPLRGIRDTLQQCYFVIKCVPISTTVVGVAVFSVTLNNNVIIEKMQMSTPEPANAVKIPEILTSSLPLQ